VPARLRAKSAIYNCLVLFCCEQSKEKLIASLKESPSSSGGKSVSDSAALVSELESIRQERDVLQDELRSSQHTADTVRSELVVSNTTSGWGFLSFFVLLNF